MRKPLGFAVSLLVLSVHGLSSAGDDFDVLKNAPREITGVQFQENEPGFCGLDGVVEAKHRGFSSTGYANTVDKAGAQVRWAVNAEKAGTYLVRIRFADGESVARPGQFIVNGEPANQLDINTTGDWNDYQLSTEVSLYLQEGVNTVVLDALTDAGLPNIDYLYLNSKNVIAADCSAFEAEPVKMAMDTVSATATASVTATASAAADTSSACEKLVNDDSVNWDESSLKNDQEIVECLASTLGKPVGFGENTTGGYNAKGGSKLVVIKKDDDKSVEQQLYSAISSDDYNWIVFDKEDFAKDSEVAMYRLFCSDKAVLSALDDATEAECREPTLWCEKHGVSSDGCFDEFFNVRLNNKKLPIRNRMIDSNTTIDGRGSNAHIFFNGFAIGGDSKGKPTHVTENVIVTNMEFRGAGHSEDHGLDPDMIRSTGTSKNIWIHQNTFDTTGDSAWDMKVGAHNITISFNKLLNVKRAGLMGASDSRSINEQITATMHNNLFVTLDQYYASKHFDTLRRVPLLRRGQLHMFNNVFYGYRKDILSTRKGGRILFEDNMVLNNAVQAANHKNKDDMEYFIAKLLRDYREGGLEVRDSVVWMSDDHCQLQGDAGDLTASHGSTPEMADNYSKDSKNSMQENKMAVGQDLADYLFATAGKGGEAPYLSPLAKATKTVINNAPSTCQQASKVH